MADDNAFRLALIVVVAAFTPFTVYHRIRSVTNEKLDRWQDRTYNLTGAALRFRSTSSSCIGRGR